MTEDEKQERNKKNGNEDRYEKLFVSGLIVSAIVTCGTVLEQYSNERMNDQDIKCKNTYEYVISGAKNENFEEDEQEIIEDIFLENLKQCSDYDE